MNDTEQPSEPQIFLKTHLSSIRSATSDANVERFAENAYCYVSTNLKGEEREEAIRQIGEAAGEGYKRVLSSCNKPQEL